MTQSRKDGRKAAVALSYEPSEDKAPRVVASGKGKVAEAILAIAAQHGIPVKEDADLAELLAKLDLGEEVPPELYRVVAEVFAWLYRVKKKRERSQLLTATADVAS
ncbi:MAG: EscU/YscU/HrcU family type III secretion system export apparatus switch protein [Calditrichaeota bacterium]|nr:EscU/YscU/HrcU family type III secretion system export apparatus switch protein [Calditrichota bacterium]